MNPLKQLIHEIHRRSLWQVMGIFLAASWGVLQVVEVVTESVGLPDWTPGMAFVLLLIGLPVVLATAFVQEGMPGAEAAPDDGGALAESPAPQEIPRSAPPSPAMRVLTWRNAILGGLGAFTLLGVSLVAYLVMWETGVGPWGNLAAQGVFEEGEPVILADFENRSNDETLSSVVTEALRVDLASSQAITLLSTSRVEEVLGLMQRDPAAGLPADIAREVAVRDGIKAVIEGDVGSAGSGYILSATIRATESGDPLATFRRTAKSAGDVIDAIDGLSQDIREKAGESLRRIKAEPGLDRVTTASLDALRLYSQGEALAEAGEARRAKEVLQEAVTLDPGFAMAWRKLAVVIQTAGGEPGELEAAATRAYDLRNRLTDVERGNAVAYYHRVITGDVPAQIEAYETVLEKYPDDPPSLNNLAIAYADRLRFEDAIVLLDRAIGGPGESGSAHVNRIAYYASLGRVTEAREAWDVMTAKYSGRNQWSTWSRWFVEGVAGEYQAAHELGDQLANRFDLPVDWQAVGTHMGASVDAASGRLAEARAHAAQASQRYQDEDEAVAFQWISALSASLEHYLGDDAAAGRYIRTLLASEEFAALPPPARDWPRIFASTVLTGDRELTRTVLQRWSSDDGERAGTALAEARVVADALSRPDPGSSINALKAFRAQIGCPRCYEWELGGLSRAAGRLEDAAQHFETTIAVRTSTAYESFLWMRVLGHEQLGEIHDQLGNGVRAAEHYTRFADAWAAADPELQPRVLRARERAAALRAGG